MALAYNVPIICAGVLPGVQLRQRRYYVLLIVWNQIVQKKFTVVLHVDIGILYRLHAGLGGLLALPAYLRQVCPHQRFSGRRRDDIVG